MNSHTGPEHTKTPLATTSQDKIKSYQLLDNSKDVEDEEMAGMGEVDFNLDAAIDDLGSYLGTWDPEREASFL